MPKLKTNRGFRFIKELGGAVKRDSPSFAATWLVKNDLVSGRVLDYGCGFGFDADHFGWEGFDPYYRQQSPSGEFDTIICNHVLNMLTRTSRKDVIQQIQKLLSPDGIGWLIVPRNIPVLGKVGLRKRIQNYVRLDLPSEFCDDQMEIYKMSARVEVKDLTNEIERRLAN